MAEDNSQEKSEEPTQKRLEKSREEGKVARSKELNTSAVLLAGTVGLLVFGDSIATAVARVTRLCFSFDGGYMESESQMFSYLGAALFEVGGSLLPLLLTLLVAALFGPLVLGGWLISTSVLAPKLERMDPLKGLKKMFSLNSLVELLKGMLKISLIAVAAIVFMALERNALISLRLESVMPAISHSAELLAWAGIALAACTIIIAAIDVPYQIFEHKRQLKMTFQEVKDEIKDTDGKPEVKGRIRQLQHEMAQRRMMGAVPEADVVITNPSHYSVVLKYDGNQSSAPIVVAKGADLIAFKIREVARAHEVPVLEAAPLARAIYHTTELDQEIPEALYLAVAKVLAYVFQLKSYRPGRGRKPKPPVDYPIPDSMRFD